MRARITIVTITATLAAALTACSSDDSSSVSQLPTPAYEITKQDDSGNSREVEVTVRSGKNLKAVFDAVTKNLSDDAGYHIYINCSTGGTGTSDNRLANGRLARGDMGEAATGLKDGETEFETVKGRTCP
ncbi:hypothetical protein ACH4JS_34845 [Streptomyces sp. NPDC017638]|uniref:hypothetical protein n=1 Tax=unclassified Streptomyces TaxID=2593676 RepID=UPI0029664BE2|nr:hypothetical protein [Streptomyces sp. SCL15-4]